MTPIQNIGFVAVLVLIIFAVLFCYLKYYRNINISSAVSNLSINTLINSIYKKQAEFFQTKKK